MSYNIKFRKIIDNIGKPVSIKFATISGEKNETMFVGIKEGKIIAIKGNKARIFFENNKNLSELFFDTDFNIFGKFYISYSINNQEKVESWIYNNETANCEYDDVYEIEDNSLDKTIYKYFKEKEEPKIIIIWEPNMFPRNGLSIKINQGDIVGFISNDDMIHSVISSDNKIFIEEKINLQDNIEFSDIGEYYLKDSHSSKLKLRINVYPSESIHKINGIFYNGNIEFLKNSYIFTYSNTIYYKKGKVINKLLISSDIYFTSIGYNEEGKIYVGVYDVLSNEGSIYEMILSQ